MIATPYQVGHMREAGLVSCKIGLDSSIMMSIWCLVIFATASLATADKLNEFVHHYESLRLSPKIASIDSNRITARIDFRAHNRQFSLRVKTNTRLFTNDFKLRVHSAGKIRHEKVDTRHIVTGYLEGEKEVSLVHGRISSNHFEGVIHTSDEIYHVEPMTRYHQTSPQHTVVVYKASDVHYDLINAHCNTSLEHTRLRKLQEHVGMRGRLGKPINTLKKRQSGAPEDANTCTVHVFADYLFYANVGLNDVANTLATMAEHVAFSDRIYRGTGFGVNGEDVTGYGLAIQGADVIQTNTPSDNPLYGEFTTDGLLDAFASYYTLDNVCLGHLFTYRDFRGVIGLAFVADPSGRLSGGICQQRTQTFGGEKNLNTGFTSLLNYGRRLPQAVSSITTAHEIGHNFGSPHDSTAECTPGGTQGNYIMYPSATNGNLPNNQMFSTCSKDIMGRTIAAKGGCFQKTPQLQECGNGIIEGDEECDCGSNDTVTCRNKDPCCVPGNCTLKEGANCSPAASSCCSNDCEASNNTVQCRMGDGDCLEESYCDGVNFVCPQPERKDGIPCNNGSNVCVNGVCSGSICLLNDLNAEPCFCFAGPDEEDTETLCHVCCIFDSNAGCVSTFTRPGVTNATIKPGFPCANFTGYCNDEMECIIADTNRPLDDLLDIIPSFSSIVEWLQYNWYWVLGGIAVTIVIIILLQLTYRRKKLKNKTRQGGRSGQQRQREEMTESARLLRERDSRQQRDDTYL